MSSSDVVLGIDFGTTYTSAAAIINDQISFVLDGGDNTIPSIVHFPSSGRPLVGRPALTLAITDPENTVVSIKRILGRTVDDVEVRRVNASVAYKIKPGPNKVAILNLRGVDYAPAQIVAMILEHVRELAQRRFGGFIRRAVMTHPAAASESYHTALKQAARIAGLEVIQLVPEPVAGALALGKNRVPANRQMVICDFGGGTFDTTWSQQQGHTFSTLAVSGDPFLGGDDFDEAMAQFVANYVFQQTRFEIKHDVAKWGELIRRCETVKRRLSAAAEATLTMRDAYIMAERQCDLNLKLTRAHIEPTWKPLFERTHETINKLLQSIGKTKEEADEIILIGGTSLIPAVQRAVSKFFGKQAECSEFADVAVTMGAALTAAALSK